MLLLSPSLGSSSSSSSNRRPRPLRRNRPYSFPFLLLLASFLAVTTLVIAASSPSYYKILDIDPSADAKTIKKAYRRLAQRLHPDKHPEKEEEFVKMSEAYQVLSDEELRKVYDKFGEDGVKRHQAGKAGGVSRPNEEAREMKLGGKLLTHSYPSFPLFSLSARPQTTPLTSSATSSAAAAKISKCARANRSSSTCSSTSNRSTSATPSTSSTNVRWSATLAMDRERGARRTWALVVDVRVGV